MSFVDVNAPINIDGKSLKEAKNWGQRQVKKYGLMILLLTVIGLLIYILVYVNNDLKNEKIKSQDLSSKLGIMEAENKTWKFQIEMLKEYVTDIKNIVANSSSDGKSKADLLEIINQKEKSINSIIQSYETELELVKRDFYNKLKTKDIKYSELKEANESLQKGLDKLQRNYDSTLRAFDIERNYFKDSIKKLNSIINDTTSIYPPRF